MKAFDSYPRSKPLAWLVVSLLVALVTGCSGGADVGTGTLAVSLTDAPACGFDKVYVTVNKVRVHQRYSASDKDAGWTDIPLNPARKIDLLSLNNGALDNLGEAPLPAGHYTQLRLVLDPNTSGGLANSVVPTGGVETALVTPSAVQSGIKLINEFDVASGQRVDLMLDFNACKSIVLRGKGTGNVTYALKPVIKVIPFALNGIDGFVDTAMLNSNVMVTAQQNGVVVQSTAPKANGEFFLTRLAPGNYDVVITADGHATAVIAAVPVATTTSTTVVSASGNGYWITLHASATNTVSGKVNLPSSSTEVAYVTAKQTIGTGPIVSIKTVAADDAPSTLGDYSLILPVDAPWLGQYTTVPPAIILAAQSGVAGQYTMEASANGYQTSLPTDADISAGDAVNINFSIAP
jgi:hypothetical protein